MKRFLVVFMSLGLIAGSVATAEAQPEFESTQRTVEARYYGPQELGWFEVCAPLGEVVCVSIETTEHERSLTASVTDAHGQPVLAAVYESGGNKFYGSFCGQTTSSIYFPPGADLELYVRGESWPTWWVYPEFDCSPAPATTGTVSVTLWGQTPSEEPTSPSPIGSPDPQSSPSDQTDVERSVDLELRRHLRGVGTVDSADPSCLSDVPVVIQRKSVHAWLDIASTRTDAHGVFAVKLTDRRGRYRAVASEVTQAETTCISAASPVVRHQH